MSFFSPILIIIPQFFTVDNLTRQIALIQRIFRTIEARASLAQQIIKLTTS